MRAVLLLLLLIGVVSLIASPAAAGDSLAIVPYGADPSLRDALIREVPVFADLGGRVVARVSHAAAARLLARGLVPRYVPEPGPGERLAAIFTRSATWRPAGVRVLAVDHGLFLVAGAPPAVAALRRPGLVHGGVQAISLAEPYVPAPAVRLGAVDGPDPRISALVAQVQKANLITHIGVLSSIWTRRASHPDNAKAITYVKNQLARFGRFTVKTETFSSYYGPNVIAELKGYEKPDEIVMVGGHVDSYARGGSSVRSPGADDNGSGSATVLELARVFANAPLQRTVRFAWWNAEEMGLVGSYAYARAARSRGDKILAYLNTDMNAYRASGDTVDVDFVTNDSTPSLITQLSAISKIYVPTLGVKQGYLGGGTSDHRSFYRNGFPAVFYFEDLDKYSPYIHTSYDDTIRSTNDMNLATLISRSICAGLATLALPLPAPSFTLSATSGPSVGGTGVTASGSFLGSATAVKVGGRPVPFTVGTSNVSFQTPTSPSLGNVFVEITNPGGTGKAAFTYVKTAPPALRVPDRMSLGASGSGAVGGEPGYLSVTLFSLWLGSTNMGLITLDIGHGSPGNVFYYHVAVLAAGGGTVELPLGVPREPKLVGLKFHFQAAVVEPALKSIAKTNVDTVTITS